MKENVHEDGERSSSEREKGRDRRMCHSNDLQLVCG